VIVLNKNINLLLQIIIGIIIMIAPILITGSIYDVTKSFGELLVAELIIRTLSLIIGLLVISTALHRYSQ
jgi:type IV secretory pathway VirB6-like protein